MSRECSEPVAILWDIENCGVPQGVNAEDVSVHIRMAVKSQLAVRGSITLFSAYGDFSHLPLRTRQGCQKTGVDMIDIPHGTKDAADKAILADMFLFALNNPPPCTLVLITGDVDFAPALHKLGQRGYSVVLIIPSGRKVSPALLNACHHLWSWPDIARGKCTNPMHNVLPHLFLQDSHRKDILRSTKTARKTAATCARTLEAVVTLAGNVGGKGFISSIKDSELLKTTAANAEEFCMDQVEGNDHSENHCADGVAEIFNFGKLEVHANGNQIAYEVSQKLPVDMFEECVDVPFYIVKESTETLVATENGIRAAKIPLATSHDIAGFAKESGKMLMVMGVDTNNGEAFDTNRSFPPPCRTAYPVPSYGIHVASQGMDDCFTSYGIGPLPADMEGDNHCSFPCNLAPSNAQGSVTRSQDFQQIFENFKRSKIASKEAALSKGKGHDPCLQLKVKEKTKKKAFIVEAGPVATSKLTKRERKDARSAAMQSELYDMLTTR